MTAIIALGQCPQFFAIIVSMYPHTPIKSTPVYGVMSIFKCRTVCVSVCVCSSTYKPSDDQCMDRRLWPTQKSLDERAKHLYYCQQHQNAVSSYLLTHHTYLHLATSEM